MLRVVAALLLLVVVALAVAEDPDVQRTGPQLITSKGLPCEEHWVHTPDYFILELIRIPRPGAPVVFLQHGLLDSADTWLVNPRESGPAYLFYDGGYDVWMGNSRGNKYSRNNTKYSPNWPFDAQFWDFSYTEMAKYDLPTQVEYVLKTTGRDTLTYVGHSQGTTQAFANFATPEWSAAEKINLAIMLAPVARTYHTTSLMVKALADLDVGVIIEFLGAHEFLPTSKLLRWLLPGVCSATPLLCESVIYLFAGLDLGDLIKSRLPVYVSHFPSGTSVHDMVHWSQGVKNDRFAQFDYGLVENELKYGQSSPPKFDLSNIQAGIPPIALFSGGQDTLADPTDVAWLTQQLGTDKIVFQKEIPSYAHLDFVWGEHCNSTIFGEALELTRQYNK